MNQRVTKKREMEKNEIELTVSLTFTGDANVTQKDKQIIIANVLDALKNQVNSGNGIAPDEPEHSEYTTEFIDVRDEENIGLCFDLAHNELL